MKVCDLQTGKLVLDTTVPATTILKSIAVHETDFGLIVFTAKPSDRRTASGTARYAYHQAFVQGFAHGIDCRNGKVLWSTELPQQFVPLPQPRDLPFVLMNYRRGALNQRGQASKFDFPLDVLDTRTGKSIASLTESSSFYDFRPTVDLDRREFSIKLGGQRSAVLSYAAAGESDPRSEKDGP